jgi:hypothetical protein
MSSALGELDGDERYHWLARATTPGTGDMERSPLDAAR